MPLKQPAAAPAFCLSLHIRHPSLDPQEISRELQLTPEDAFGAGEPRRARTYLGAGVHGETYWAARLDPVFWRKSGYLRTFDPRPQLEPAAPVGELPADRGARFELLVERGRGQGYLTHAELRQHLPGETGERGEMEDVVRTLGELGIPVHEQASPALAAIQRLRGVDLGPLRTYLDHHPALHLVDVLSLVCLRLATQHGAFLEKIRAEGGSVRLLVTLSSKAVHGLTMTPELSGRLAHLGITLELALAAGTPVRRAKARA
jgi:hypothetical protein